MPPLLYDIVIFLDFCSKILICFVAKDFLMQTTEKICFPWHVFKSGGDSAPKRESMLWVFLSEAWQNLSYDCLIPQLIKTLSTAVAVRRLRMGCSIWILQYYSGKYYNIEYSSQMSHHRRILLEHIIHPI